MTITNIHYIMITQNSSGYSIIPFVIIGNVY